MQVAARTYRAWTRAQPSARDLGDAVILDALLATVGTAEGMYGRRKMVAFLRRRGHDVSARQVDRLMRHLDVNGRVRGQRLRTTIPDRNAARAPDLLDRDSPPRHRTSAGWRTSPMSAPGPGSFTSRS